MKFPWNLAPLPIIVTLPLFPLFFPPAPIFSYLYPSFFFFNLSFLIPFLRFAATRRTSGENWTRSTKHQPFRKSVRIIRCRSRELLAVFSPNLSLFRSKKRRNFHQGPLDVGKERKEGDSFAWIFDEWFVYVSCHSVYRISRYYLGSDVIVRFAKPSQIKQNDSTKAYHDYRLD